MLSKGKSLTRLACCAICCLAAARAAQAAPPPGSGGSGLLERASGLLGAKPTRAETSRLDFQRLDLRAPDALPAQRSPAAIEDATTAFPSAKLARIASDTHPEDSLPALGGGVPMRTMSRAEDLARRVQREGVPLARLWESRSALLHVGLSPRGKPGLWLIQKVP